MAKSSANTQTAKANSKAHMLRESYTSYLIINKDAKNEHKVYSEDEDLDLSISMKITKEKTKRGMQQKAVKSFIKEFVINIKEDTTLKDVENVFANYQKDYPTLKKYGISLHKDEGVFLRTDYNIEDLEYKSFEQKFFKDGKDVTNQVESFRPNKDIFYNKKDEKWYFDKNYSEPADTKNDLKMFMNYHAHIRYSSFNYAIGKTTRMTKQDLANIQDITAQTLNMTRTESSVVKDIDIRTTMKDTDNLQDFKKEYLSTKAKLQEKAPVAKKRMNHRQLKQMHDTKKIEKEFFLVEKKHIQTEVNTITDQLIYKIENNNKIKQKELDAIKKQLDDKIKESTLENAEKTKLYRRNRALTSMLKTTNKAKELTIADLKTKLNDFESTMEELQNKRKDIVEDYNKLAENKNLLAKVLQEIKPDATDANEVKDYVQGLELTIKSLPSQETAINLMMNNTELEKQSKQQQLAINTLKAELKAANDTKEIIKHTNSKLELKTNTLNSTINTLEEQNKQLASNVSQKVDKAELDVLQERYNADIKKIEDISKKTIDKLDSLYVDLNAEEDNVEFRVTPFLDFIRSKFAEFKNTICELSDKVRNLEEKNDELKSTDSLNTNLKNQNSEILKQVISQYPNINTNNLSEDLRFTITNLKVQNQLEKRIQNNKSSELSIG